MRVEQPASDQRRHLSARICLNEGRIQALGVNDQIQNLVGLLLTRIDDLGRLHCQVAIAVPPTHFREHGVDARRAWLGHSSILVGCEGWFSA